jgi:hypothetical protein
MKLLAACQTLETLEALERNRQAETNKRQVIKSVYSDTSPPCSSLQNRIHRNCNALVDKASSAIKRPSAGVFGTQAISAWLSLCIRRPGQRGGDGW